MILDCGHENKDKSKYFPGYGVDKNNHKLCYDCCAKNDLEYMHKNNKTTLYLVDNEVTDWTGKLRFKVNNIKKNRHNMSGVRYDVWFYDDTNTLWHGIQYGNNTQILHCRKLKHS